MNELDLLRMSDILRMSPQIALDLIINPPAGNLETKKTHKEVEKSQIDAWYEHPSCLNSNKWKGVRVRVLLKETWNEKTI